MVTQAPKTSSTPIDDPTTTIIKPARKFTLSPDVRKVAISVVLVALGTLGILLFRLFTKDDPTAPADIVRLENRGFTNVMLVEEGDGIRPSVYDVQVGESDPPCVLTITMMGGADGPTYDGRTDLSLATIKANATEFGLTHCFGESPK